MLYCSILSTAVEMLFTILKLSMSDRQTDWRSSTLIYTASVQFRWLFWPRMFLWATAQSVLACTGSSLRAIVYIIA